MSVTHCMHMYPVIQYHYPLTLRHLHRLGSALRPHNRHDCIEPLLGLQDATTPTTRTSSQPTRTGESTRTHGGGSSRQPHTHQVQTSTDNTEPSTPTPISQITLPDDPLQYLLPDSNEDGVSRVSEIRVQDKGSRPQQVRVHVAGVPLDVTMDTGTDITLIGSEDLPH